MKKNLLKLAVFILVASFVLTFCKKAETKEEDKTTIEIVSSTPSSGSSVSLDEVIEVKIKYETNVEALSSLGYQVSAFLTGNNGNSYGVVNVDNTIKKSIEKSREFVFKLKIADYYSGDPSNSTSFNYPVTLKFRV